MARTKKKSIQLSTSFSDLVLAAACAHMVFLLLGAELRQVQQAFLESGADEGFNALREFLGASGKAEASRLYAALSFALIGVAAGWGVLRFGRVPGARGPHEFFTDLALFVSTPLLGLCAYAHLPLPITGFGGGQLSTTHEFLLSGLGLLLLNWLIFGFLFADGVKAFYTFVTGACAMASMIYLGVLHAQAYPLDRIDSGKRLIAGSCLYILAGTAIGSTGYYFDFVPRVDVFHYVLAAANLVIAYAFNAIFV